MIYGGNSDDVQNQLKNVKIICSTDYAFVATKFEYKKIIFYFFQFCCFKTGGETLFFSFWAALISYVFFVYSIYFHKKIFFLFTLFYKN